MSVTSRPEDISRVFVEGLIQEKVRSTYFIKNVRGMNASPNPSEIDDNEVLFLQNFIPYPNWGLRKVPSWTTLKTLTGSGLTILRQIEIFINDLPYVISALSDGSMVAVKLTDLSVSTIGAANSFSVSPPPAFSQWQEGYLLIIDKTKGYYSWNGTTLTSINANVKGTGIAVFAGQVWILSGNVLNVTAPNSYTDFTTANGGGTIINTFATLKGEWVAIIATSTILYIFGQSDVYAITNVQILPSGTLFAPIQDLQANVGCLYPDTVQALSNVVFTFDKNGVWAITGYVANRLSVKIDTYLALRDTSFNPVGCVTSVWGIPVYGIVVYLSNPSTQTKEYWMFCMNPDFGLEANTASWFVVNYGFGNFTFAVTNSAKPDLPSNFAAAGLQIISMFNPASTNAITTAMYSKNYDLGEPDYAKKLMRLGMLVSGDATVNFNIFVSGGHESWTMTLLAPVTPVTVINAASQIVTTKNASNVTVQWASTRREGFNYARANGRCSNFEILINETSNVNYSIAQIALDIERRTRWG